MLRKSPKKSNLSSIGIFQGKKAPYNCDILEVLFTDACLTDWEIAKKICSQKYHKWKLKVKTRSLYVTIQREGGRLGELVSKGYVRVKDKKYELTLKGAIAALLVEPRLIGHMNPHYSTVSFVMSRDIAPSVMDEDAPLMLSELAERTCECLNVINLDGVPENKLIVVVSMIEKEDGSNKAEREMEK